MGLSIIPRVYTYDDLESQPLETAPSLDLPHLIVDEFLMPRDGGKYMLFITHVDKSYRPDDGCPYCRSKDLKLEGRASSPRLVHDVTRNNYRVDIAIMPPRMSCRQCGAKFTPPINGISGSRQMTTRLEEYLRKECFLQPFTQLSERSGFSISTISDIMDEEIVKYDKMREDDPLEAPEVLGIDEKHLGRIMRGTIVDVKKRLLLDIFEDNGKKTMSDGIKKLKDYDKNIKVVTTDMNNAYIPMLTDTLPDATIVIDRFHVIQDVEQSIRACKPKLISYRQSVIDAIPDLQERAEQAAILSIVKKTPRLFNFSMGRLLREEESDRLKKLATVIDAFPEFRMLHNIHYAVQHMYAQETREEAERIWDEWRLIMPPYGAKANKDWYDTYDMPLGAFDDFQKFNHSSFQYFRPYILNYFVSSTTRVTNGVTEGLNNLIESVNMSGNGYKYKHLRAKCLYASLIHERLHYSMDVKTIKVKVPKYTTQYTTGWTEPEMELQTRTAIDFDQMKEDVSYPLPNIDGGNEWLEEMVIAKDDLKGDTEQACCDEHSIMLHIDDRYYFQ